MRAISPPESVHALAPEQLRAPGVAFYAAWAGETLAGVGALKALDAAHGEIKSMRTAPAFRGRGVGAALLAHLIAVARERGYARVSLETGTSAPFVPAQRLYEKAGFADCAPFAAYRADPFARFMTLAL
jgi:putative acetyltransferase